MLPKTKDGEIDTYLLGAPVALGAILSIIALVFLFYHFTPAPQDTKDGKTVSVEKADSAGGHGAPAAKGAQH